MLPVSVEELWEFHSSADSLRVLTPPDRQMRLLSQDLSVTEGAVQEMGFVQFGMPMLWRARLEAVRPPHEFTDVALKSPFKAWRHHHEFISRDEGSLLRDTVNYLPPGGPLASLVDRWFVARQIDQLFDFRHRQTANYFQDRQKSIKQDTGA